MSQDNKKNIKTDNCISHNIEKGTVLYYARVIPNCGIYDVIEVKVRTVTDEYFVGTDARTKQAFLFGYNDLEKIVFSNRKECLTCVKEKEKCAKTISQEEYYEEY